MRVGTYVDAFNLYYGARDHCGRRTAGWRWLDIVGLARSLIDDALWPNADVTRLVYCTAPRDRAGDPTSILDQSTYCHALEASFPTVVLEWGQYVPRVKSGDLVNRRNKRLSSPGADQLPEWLPVEETLGPEGHTVLRAAITTFEEKGSDVNVASHLLLDTLIGEIDAAIVITNDSDLRFPLREVRHRIPVGTVNPGKKPTAKGLRGESSEGAGRHWWRKLGPRDFLDHQLPDVVAEHTRPHGW